MIYISLLDHLYSRSMKAIVFATLGFLSITSAYCSGEPKIYKQALCEAQHPKTGKAVRAMAIGTHQDGLRSSEQMITMAERTAQISCNRKLQLAINGNENDKLSTFRVLGFHDCDSFEESSCDYSRFRIEGASCSYIQAPSLNKIDIGQQVSVCMNGAVCRVQTVTLDEFGNVLAHPVVKIRVDLACPALRSGGCPPADACFRDTEIKIGPARSSAKQRSGGERYVFS